MVFGPIPSLFVSPFGSFFGRLVAILSMFQSIRFFLAANDLFQIGGHLHPVTVIGRGADKMRLPCFVVSDRSVSLPAFGPFKGGLKFSRSPDRQLYPFAKARFGRDKTEASSAS